MGGDTERRWRARRIDSVRRSSPIPCGPVAFRRGHCLARPRSRRRRGTFAQTSTGAQPPVDGRREAPRRDSIQRRGCRRRDSIVRAGGGSEARRPRDARAAGRVAKRVQRSRGLTQRNHGRFSIVSRAAPTASSLIVPSRASTRLLAHRQSDWRLPLQLDYRHALHRARVSPSHACAGMVHGIFDGRICIPVKARARTCNSSIPYRPRAHTPMSRPCAARVPAWLHEVLPRPSSRRTRGPRSRCSAPRDRTLARSSSFTASTSGRQRPATRRVCCWRRS